MGLKTYGRVAQPDQSAGYTNRRSSGSNPSTPTASTSDTLAASLPNAPINPAGQFKPDTTLGFRHEKLGEPECPYLERWVFNAGPLALRLHHFFRSDEPHLHDHPWWFVTLVLRGAYSDVTECRRCEGKGCELCHGVGRLYDNLRPGSIRFRPALHRHRVVTGGCWTLLVTGPKTRDWGFWVDGRWVRQRKYFRKHASHACD